MALPQHVVECLKRDMGRCFFPPKLHVGRRIVLMSSHPGLAEDPRTGAVVSERIGQLGCCRPGSGKRPGDHSPGPGGQGPTPGAGLPPLNSGFRGVHHFRLSYKSEKTQSMHGGLIPYTGRLAGAFRCKTNGHPLSYSRITGVKCIQVPRCALCHAGALFALYAVSHAALQYSRRLNDLRRQLWILCHAACYTRGDFVSCAV